MTTYICKCGRTFQKNTEAGTTGFRMPDYGPGYECYGCPFVRTAEVFDPFMNQISKVAECRGVRVEGENLPEISDSILKEIKEAKSLARKKTEKSADTDQVSFTAGKGEQTGRRYVHANWVYYVKQREDNGKFTAFFNFTDAHEGENLESPVATIPDFDTFEQAQNALDGYAIKHGYEKECSAGADAPEMEQPEDAQEDLGPDGMEELAEHQELTQTDTGEAPESGNDKADSVNDQPEEQQGPCDWKNASGADEDEDDPEDEPEEVSGDPLDLRGDEFDFIVNPANAALNRFVAMLHAKKQHDGEINLKVTFEDEGGSYIFGGAVSGKINLTMKPQKVTGDAVELQFDAQGNPIIPADREHQLSFDELQPGREIPPTGTATVDGKTGIVESYQEDGGADDEGAGEVPGEVQEAAEPAEKLYPCENFDCPFYGLPDDGDAGCCYDQDARDTRDPSIKSDVVDAVHFYRCTRPEVIQAFAEVHPDKESDASDAQDVNGNQSVNF